MSIKTLEAIKNTDYEVVVTRDELGDYEVEVRKPAYSNDPFVSMETLAIRYLKNNSSERDLNRLVREVIDTDQPSLVGKYTDEETDDYHQYEYN